MQNLLLRCVTRSFLIRNDGWRIVLTRKFIFVVLGACLWVTLLASASPLHDPIEGVWMTEDKNAAVEFYKCDGHICGRFHWVRNDDDTPEGRDRKHRLDADKDPKGLCHLQFIGGFKGDGEGHYADGWITSPNDGATYDADMTLLDRETLKLHGYLWLPILGESQVWKRAKPMPDCRSK